jgi:hypothetical protein
MAGRPTPPARGRGGEGEDDGAPAPSGLRTPLVAGYADERERGGAADARRYAPASGAAFDAEAAAWPGLDDEGEGDDLLLGPDGGTGPGAALRVSALFFGCMGFAQRARARSTSSPPSPPSHSHHAPPQHPHRPTQRALGGGRSGRHQPPSTAGRSPGGTARLGGVGGREPAAVNHRFTPAERARLAAVEGIEYLPPDSAVYRRWLAVQPHG